MKRFLTLLLALCLLPIFPVLGESPVHLSGFLLPVYRQTEVPEGYIGLYTYEDIQKIVDDPAGKFMLMDDITFPALTENPLRMVGFTGVLDGNGYGFHNVNTTVYINPRDTYYVGLFGWVRDGEICNLYVDGKIHLADSFHLECRSYTGSIAGRVWGASTIFNCVTKVKISFENSMADFLFGYHGGVVGYLNCDAGATISYCHNLGEIYATEHVGGIVGYVELEKKAALETPSVFACLNDGDIETHSGNVGGIAGMALNNTDSALVIASCVNNGSVYSPYYNGGIVGKADGIQVKDCLNTGTVMTKDSPYTFVGGIVHSGNAAVINCINTGTLVGSQRSVVYSPNAEGSQGNYCLDTSIKNISKGENAQSAAGILNSDQMCIKESFPALDFNTAWVLNDGMEYPYPKPLVNNDVFDPIWPLSPNLMRITTLSYYWNSGKPYGHSCSGGQYHIGLDIAAKLDPVYAIEDGEVVTSQYSTNSGYGNYIKIRHTVKDAAGTEHYIYSLYAHLNDRKNASGAEIKVGDVVKKGDIIGKSGNTSAKYTNMGYHLHFELFEGTKAGNYIDGNIWMAYRHLDLTYDDTCYKANNSFKSTDSASQAVIDYLDVHYQLNGSTYTRISHADNYSSFIDNLTKVSQDN